MSQAARVGVDVGVDVGVCDDVAERLFFGGSPIPSNPARRAGARVSKSLNSWVGTGGGGGTKDGGETRFRWRRSSIRRWIARCDGPGLACGLRIHVHVCVALGPRPSGRFGGKQGKEGATVLYGMDSVGFVSKSCLVWLREKMGEERQLPDVESELPECGKVSRRHSSSITLETIPRCPPTERSTRSGADRPALCLPTPLYDSSAADAWLRRTSVRGGTAAACGPLLGTRHTQRYSVLSPARGMDARCSQDPTLEQVLTQKCQKTNKRKKNLGDECSGVRTGHLDCVGAKTGWAKASYVLARCRQSGLQCPDYKPDPIKMQLRARSNSSSEGVGTRTSDASNEEMEDECVPNLATLTLSSAGSPFPSTLRRCDPLNPCTAVLYIDTCFLFLDNQ